MNMLLQLKFIFMLRCTVIIRFDKDFYTVGNCYPSHFVFYSLILMMQFMVTPSLVPRLSGRYLIMRGC